MAQLIIDLVNNGGGVQTLMSPVALTQATTGASFAAENLDVSTNAILSIGALAAGNTNVVIQIEESSTGTNAWTAIPGMTFTAVTGSTGFTGTTQIVRGQRTQTYVRANAVTVTGTTPSFLASVVLVSQGKFSSVGSSFGTGVDRYPSS